MCPFGLCRGFAAPKAILAVVFAAVTALFTTPASAQNTRLTLSGTIAITIPTPTAADYAAGWKASATGVTYTVDALSGGSRTARMYVRAGCSDLGAGKTLGDLQWRRSDLSTWTSITNSDVLVEQRVMTTNGANDPWSNTIFVRILLDWVNDEPNPYYCDLKITLSQTVP
jgi:hypothetical protein